MNCKICNSDKAYYKHCDVVLRYEEKCVVVKSCNELYCPNCKESVLDDESSKRVDIAGKELHNKLGSLC